LPVVTMPKRGARAVDHRAVEPVGAREGERGIELVPCSRSSCASGGSGPADVQPPRRHLEILRQAIARARVDVDEAELSTVSAIALHRDPAAGVARHRPAVRPSRGFLHAGRVQHRDHRVHEGVFALVRGGGRLAGVVVAGSSSTPPCFAVPANWRANTSPERSTPGPLPYHIANTPSYFAPGNR
jgi:hypothetical protein